VNRRELAQVIADAIAGGDDEYSVAYVDASDLSYVVIDGQVNLLTAADAVLGALSAQAPLMSQN
jgi:hypothetical protein